MANISEDTDKVIKRDGTELSCEARMEIFDTLPYPIREALWNGQHNFSSVWARNHVKEYGVTATIKELTTNDILARATRAAYGPNHPDLKK